MDTFESHNNMNETQLQKIWIVPEFVMAGLNISELQLENDPKVSKSFFVWAEKYVFE